MNDSSDKIPHILGLLGPALLLRWPSGSKGHRCKWGHLQLTDMNDPSYLAKLENGNIGVALGPVSNGLVTIDFDQDSYADAFLAANPVLGNTLRTSASRGCNIWLRCLGHYPGDYPPSCYLTNSTGNKIGEWRGKGNQTIISGTHPEGVLYRFVVEKPAITIGYEAITWPDSITPPSCYREYESKRVRENEVVGVCVVDGGLSLERVGDLISQIAPKGFHQNNASLFNLARLIKSCESAIGRQATDEERAFVFDRWCLASRRFWRPGLTRDDYWAEFLEACHYARIGLDHDPVQVALSRAKAAPLPDVFGFTDERIRLLAAICRELSTIMGGSTFFLPTRKMGDSLEVHHTRVARWLRALEFKQIIHLAPGEVRRRGGNRCPRYQYGPPTPPIGVGIPQHQPPALPDSQSVEAP